MGRPRAFFAAALAVAFVSLLGGCAARGPALRERRDFVTRAGTFELRYGAGDEEAARQLQEAIEKATPRLALWGGLREPVRVRVLPTHGDLEDAANRDGYAWLRAWARYDEVLVQSPRSWSLFGAAQSAVDELLLHELTHCVMYQASADRDSWSRKEIPLWFREGLASVTANQDYRWPGLEALARYHARHPEKDPLSHPEALYQYESDIVYGAAHHAVAFLVRRYGHERIRELMRQMRLGNRFPDAFRAAMGLTPETFEQDFRRYVRLRGFRGRQSPEIRP